MRQSCLCSPSVFSDVFEFLNNKKYQKRVNIERENETILLLLADNKIIHKKIQENP